MMFHFQLDLVVCFEKDVDQVAAEINRQYTLLLLVAVFALPIIRECIFPFARIGERVRRRMQPLEILLLPRGYFLD